MPSVLKTMLLRELTDSYENAEGVVVLGLHGLSMPENEGLRNELAEQAGVSLRVVPNRLARYAFAQLGLEFDEAVFTGASIGVVAGTPEEAIGAAKVVDKHAATKAGKVAFRAGALAGNVLDAADARALAEVPDQDTLRAQLLGCIAGPAQGLARVIDGPGSSLARVLQARVDSQPE